MTDMEEHDNLPDVDRLSVLSAVILLAYALSPFVPFQGRGVTLEISGAIFVFPVNYVTLLSFLVAALAAVGTDWLLREHPFLGVQSTWQHLLLPALTAWVIGVLLNNLQISLEWWAIFGFASFFLILVFVAEYITVDLSDARHVPATVVLTAASFALCLVVAIVLRAADARLYLLLPSVAATTFLVSLRSLYLRLGGRWCWGWALGISLFVGQVAMGVHYLPLSPLAFGLMLLGPAYSLTSLAGSLEEGREWHTVWIEPILTLFVVLVLALMVG